MRTTAQPIPSLDGLRAISIGLVIYAHFSMTYNFVGNLGVRVFFVISGYLITYLLLKEFNSTGNVNLKRFYFRRTMRIFPPFYFYLLVIGILGWFGVIEFNFRSFITPFTYTSNYLFSDSWYTAHTWSLAVEEQFYLLYPPLLVFLRKKKTLLVLISILFLAPVLRVIGFRLYGHESLIAYLYGFHASMDALASGCLLAFAAEYEAARKFLFRVSALPQLLVIVAIILIYFANTQIQEDHPLFGISICITFMNTAIALIIYWAINNSENSHIGRLLNTKALSFVGLLSYSLYLWQQAFSEEKAMSGYFPFNLLAAFVCALISYYTVERYSLKLRNYLERRQVSKDAITIK